MAQYVGRVYINEGEYLMPLEELRAMIVFGEGETLTVKETTDDLDNFSDDVNQYVSCHHLKG